MGQMGCDLRDCGPRVQDRVDDVLGPGRGAGDEDTRDVRLPRLELLVGLGDVVVLVEAEYDLVVHAVGIQPNREVEGLFSGEKLGLDEYYYVAEPNEELEPGQTDIPGVFVAGTSAGAKDIVDSILHAGAAVAQVAAHLTHAEISEVVPV